MNSIDEKIKAGAALSAGVVIAGEPFRAMVSGENGVVKLGAVWENTRQNKLQLHKLAESLELTLPDFLDWQIGLQKVGLQYESGNRLISLFMQADDTKKISFAAGLKDKVFCFRMEPELTFDLKNLPMIGKFLEREAKIRLQYLQASYHKGQGVQLRYAVLFQAGENKRQLGSPAKELPDAYIHAQVQAKPPSGEQSALEPEKKSKITWLELKKKIGPCYIRRVGFQFENGMIKICLDATVTIAVLTFDLMEFYLGIRLGQGFKPKFGLAGLAVSLNKPPLFISGGLYVAEPGRLYNGEITIKYTKFSLLALGSYGVTESGKDSFFAYVMLSYAFGGPPCFYITGLAAGFGVNRKIRLPDIKGVRDFPFVAAAMGRHSKLKPTTGAAAALQTLSGVIEPCDGMHFLTLGIRFTSFSMVESFLVVNVAFGARFELSLLGISEMSLPPGSNNPIAYGALALRAVFCPDDGILEIEGALLNDAFLFDRNCHLTGGFAFYTWFKGQWAGDFVLTVGGYHPNFRRGHYPAVDRIGINWNITDHLSLKGEAYFALTPNCLMAGGRLDIDYVDGKLKAWCHVFANFLIEWKPFHYDIEAGISIGASYRLDFWFIHHTFTLELSAYMHLWGPEFSGLVKIKWFIISFTIYFNSGSSSRPPKLDFHEFQTGFLPDLSGGMAGRNLTGKRLARLKALNGYLQTKQAAFPERSEIGAVHYLTAQGFAVEIESALPVQQIILNPGMGKDGGEWTGTCGEQFGILPMQMEQLHTRLTIRMERLERLPNEKIQKIPILLNGQIVYKNMPRAIWDSQKPDMNASMIPNLWLGYKLSGGEITGHYLPADAPDGSQRWYDLDILLKNEEHLCKRRYCWNTLRSIPQSKEPEYDADEVWDTLRKNKRRSDWLQQLADYDVRQEDEIDMESFAGHIEQLMTAPPRIGRLLERPEWI